MSSGTRSNGSRLSPWAQLPYFERPRITTYPNLGGATRVCDSNPRRVAIIFAATGGINVFLLPDASVSTGNGIELVAGLPWITLKHADYGPVVQNEWWAVPNAAGCNLTVIETIMSSWPGE